MNVDVKDYLKMPKTEYVQFLAKLHDKQVQQVYNSVRRFVSGYQDKLDHFKDDGDIITAYNISEITKSELNTRGHIPTKNESKLIRKQKMAAKKNR